MNDSISTISGQRIYTGQRPTPSQVFLSDVARSLAMQVRYLGHLTDFYSVAEHSVACVRMAQALNLPLETQRACLLHDAHEMFVGDFPSPFKVEVPGLREFERRFETPVHVAFGLPAADSRVWLDVKHVDDLDLHRAGEYLKPDWRGAGDSDKAHQGRILIGQPYCFSWQIAELTFLEMAASLGIACPSDSAGV